MASTNNSCLSFNKNENYEENWYIPASCLPNDIVYCEKCWQHIFNDMIGFDVEQAPSNKFKCVSLSHLSLEENVKVINRYRYFRIADIGIHLIDQEGNFLPFTTKYQLNYGNIAQFELKTNTQFDILISNFCQEKEHCIKLHQGFFNKNKVIYDAYHCKSILLEEIDKDQPFRFISVDKSMDENDEQNLILEVDLLDNRDISCPSKLVTRSIFKIQLICNQTEVEKIASNSELYLEELRKISHDVDQKRLQIEQFETEIDSLQTRMRQLFSEHEILVARTRKLKTLLQKANIEYKDKKSDC